MFVPRALRLKGVRDPKRRDDEPPAKKPRFGEATTTSERLNGRDGDSEAPLVSTRSVDTRITISNVNPEYLDQLVCGIELIFSDYAHQEEERANWLQRHYRERDGCGKFIHLSAILEHPNISSLKPAATQPLLQRALRERPSRYLELSDDGYFVRRNCSTYPLPFVPENSFEVVNDDGLSFWDQRTIYVEPHTRDLCKTPAKVVYWLRKHGGMREKWLPIQAVHFLFNSCAFVTLCGNVTHDDIWEKWRGLQKPEFWNIMTKVEHTKRTNEYIALKLQEKEAARKIMSEQMKGAVPKPNANRPKNRPKRSGHKNLQHRSQHPPRSPKPTSEIGTSASTEAPKSESRAPAMAKQNDCTKSNQHIHFSD